MSVPTRSDVVTVTVAWIGDDGAGAGVDTYDLQISEDGGDWIRLLTGTPSTSYPYTGQYGHSYTFRARATDNVSNTGVWAEATTVIVHVTKYYHFGGRRVAMRSEGQVYYLHTDHLGSTSLATTAAGAVHSRQGYYPYGETRYTASTLPTDFHFTGQRNDATIGLYDYHARWYDPALGRFISADTLVPEPASPQDFNRYAYVSNNPLKHVDPSGHCIPGWNCPEDKLSSSPTPKHEHLVAEHQFPCVSIGWTVRFSVPGTFWAAPGQTEIDIYHLSGRQAYLLEWHLAENAMPGLVMKDAATDMAIEAAEIGLQQVAKDIVVPPIGPIWSGLDLVKEWGFEELARAVHEVNEAQAVEQGEQIRIQPLTVAVIGPFGLFCHIGGCSDHTYAVNTYAVLIYPPEDNPSGAVLVRATHIDTMKEILQRILQQ